MNHDSRSFEDDLASLKADVAVIRSNYVTKADLQEVRIELKQEIHEVRTELSGEIHGLRIELKGEIQSLRLEFEAFRTEIHKAINTQTWRMIGFFAALVTAVHFVTRAGY